MTMTGKENFSWLRFEDGHKSGPIFHPLGSSSAPRTRPCEHCGETYLPSRSDARYCGDACRQRAHRQRLSVTEP
jgi:hypothetical protein